MSELKLCPSCGYEPYIQERYTAQNQRQWSVVCKCGERIFSVDRKGKVIKMWNKKVE